MPAEIPRTDERSVWLKRHTLSLLALLAAGLAIRLVIARVHPHIEADGYYYLKIAEQIRDGLGPFHLLFHPLYPLLVAASCIVVADPEWAARLVSALSGTLTLIPTAYIGHILFGPRIALFSAFLIGIHPLLTLTSTYVLTEAAYGLLITSAVALTALEMERGSGHLFPIVGLLLGAAYLTRPEGLLLLPILLGWWIHAAWRTSAPKGRTILRAGLYLISAALIAAPYLWYLRSIIGSWTLSGKVSHNLALDIGAMPGPAGALKGLLIQAPFIAWHYLRNILVFDKYALHVLFPAAILVLISFGLYSCLAEQRQVRPVLFLASLWLPTLVVPLFHIEARVFVPYLPGALIVAACGTVWLGERLSASWPNATQPSSCRITLGILGVTCMILLPHAMRPLLVKEPREEAYRKIATWVVANAPDAKRIMDRKPYIAYHSGRTFEPIPPQLRTADLLAHVRRHAVDLVVIDVALIQGDRQGVADLAFSSLAPPGLALWKSFEVPGEPPIILYRLEAL